MKFPVESSLMAVLMERKVVPKELMWRLKQVSHQSSSDIIRLPPRPSPPPHRPPQLISEVKKPSESLYE